jgi:hypothetical protein
VHFVTTIHPHYRYGACHCICTTNTEHNLHRKSLPSTRYVHRARRLHYLYCFYCARMYKTFTARICLPLPQRVHLCYLYNFLSACICNHSIMRAFAPLPLCVPCVSLVTPSTSTARTSLLPLLLNHRAYLCTTIMTLYVHLYRLDLTLCLPCTMPCVHP